MECCVCQKTKAPLVCGVCESSVCKYCAQFLDDESFSFLQPRPSILAHSTYCGPCYDAHVAADLASYNETLELAKNLLVFDKIQTKETRLMSRKEEPIQVSDCPDRQEALLRMAFTAAKAGFNALIDVDLTSKKVRINSFQTTLWKGRAIPTQVNPDKLMRDRALWHNPN